ncbi:tetratricopeptide repeat protein [Jeongeupia naejangsanensis]|uniref:Tetratricopeptide repeat protein n=1 Tax=Jeongeupia naejangsanensis TaxID=613195 RepID=A0ABS2BNG4_9NEIS|nr:tetratricopeptide repeat protein [Jeongeupia naejangsanensis]MBM3116960.1 tetratricopeptide repeat protein [Jeongeupia naejangsanensis]
MWRTFCLVAGLMLAGLASASGGGSPPARSSADSETSKAIASARQSIDQQQWDQALQVLDAARQRDPRNADLWNWTGYCERKRGNLQQAFAAYDEALRLNPRHLGAHEYLGEAWLQAGQPEKAQAVLDQLKTLCGTCEEERDLAAAIDTYRAKAQ